MAGSYSIPKSNKFSTATSAPSGVAVDEPSDEYMFMAMLAAVTHRMTQAEKNRLLMAWADAVGDASLSGESGAAG